LCSRDDLKKGRFANAMMGLSIELRENEN